MKKALFVLPLISYCSLAHQGGIHDGLEAGHASFDITHAKISAQGQTLNFHMAAADIGQRKPNATGQLAGASVFAYVWPTSLNSSVIGFDADQGIVALAVTAHPDFDDTPLFDENNDGDVSNDGHQWHSHWVVLAPNEACGAGALAVKDLTEQHRAKPITWPGLPLFIDSPGWQPRFDEQQVEVLVPMPQGIDLSTVKYDGVTAGLKVHANLHAPLLCVSDVFDIASNDLSLPATVEQEKGQTKEQTKGHAK